MLVAKIFIAVNYNESYWISWWFASDRFYFRNERNCQEFYGNVSRYIHWKLNIIFPWFISNFIATNTWKYLKIRLYEVAFRGKATKVRDRGRNRGANALGETGWWNQTDGNESLRRFMSALITASSFAGYRCRQSRLCSSRCPRKIGAPYRAARLLSRIDRVERCVEGVSNVSDRRSSRQMNAWKRAILRVVRRTIVVYAFEGVIVAYIVE